MAGIIILIVILYIPLGVIFKLTGKYSGNSKKRSRRRRRRW